jgi:hypothetical protein
MIRHFLRRDFRDCRLYWASLLLITVASLFAGVIGLTILFWVYFMFPSMAQGYILGSPWRTQHQMSRHYLLALPISHKKLFVIQQARMLVFWLPFSIFAACLPFTILNSLQVYGFYYFALFVSILVFMHSQIWSALEMESISTYVPKGYRLWAYIKIFIVVGGTMMILGQGWTNLLSDNLVARGPKVPFSEFLSLMRLIPAQTIFVGALILLAFWVPHNARRWCVTL